MSQTLANLVYIKVALKSLNNTSHLITWDYSTLQQQYQIKEDHAENEDLTKTKEP